MSTDTATDATSVGRDPREPLRLVASRTDEGIQLRLLGPAQLTAAHPAALPPPERLDPKLLGSYFVG